MYIIHFGDDQGMSIRRLRILLLSNVVELSSFWIHIVSSRTLSPAVLCCSVSPDDHNTAIRHTAHGYGARRMRRESTEESTFNIVAAVRLHDCFLLRLCFYQLSSLVSQQPSFVVFALFHCSIPQPRAHSLHSFWKSSIRLFGTFRRRSFVQG